MSSIVVSRNNLECLRDALSLALEALREVIDEPSRERLEKKTMAAITGIRQIVEELE